MHVLAARGFGKVLERKSKYALSEHVLSFTRRRKLSQEELDSSGPETRVRRQPAEDE